MYPRLPGQSPLQIPSAIERIWDGMLYHFLNISTIVFERNWVHRLSPNVAHRPLTSTEPKPDLGDIDGPYKGVQNNSNGLKWNAIFYLSDSCHRFHCFVNSNVYIYLHISSLLLHICPIYLLWCSKPTIYIYMLSVNNCSLKSIN